MDNKEIIKVIETIKGFRKLHERLNNMTLLKYCDIAIEALEKQLPKKPTYDGDVYAPDGTFVWDEWLCPCCGRRYEVDYDDYEYCPDCGQKIDWSE